MRPLSTSNSRPTRKGRSFPAASASRCVTERTPRGIRSAATPSVQASRNPTQYPAAAAVLQATASSTPICQRFIGLTRDLGLDQLGEKHERFLPAEVTGL